MKSPRRIGLLLVTVGIVLLLARFAGDLYWPLFVMIPGAILLAYAVGGPRGAARLAVPGSIVTTVGLILFIQEATDTYHAWSYAWGLVVAAAGAGTFLRATIENRPEMQQDALRTVVLGLALFAGFGLLFEALVFGGFLSGVIGWVVPFGLIAAGVFLAIRERAR